MYAGLSVILSSALCRNSTIIALIKQSVPWAQKELRMKVVSASLLEVNYKVPNAFVCYQF